MELKTYGYIRVSTKEQKEDRQLIAMSRFGIPRNRIYLDKLSGKDFDRPAYRKLLKKLKPDDTLVIKSIDRLGRNYSEMLEQWRLITKDKKARIIVLDMPILNTAQHRDLVGTLIADIVLQLLSFVAQTEREFTHQRQAEGIAAAKAKGVRFGRPPIKRPAEYERIHEAWKNKRISARKAAEKLGVTHRTFLRWARM